MTTATIRSGAVTFKGNPIDLLGPALAVGQPAPDFHVQGIDLADVTLKQFAGKPLVVVTVPSLDTSVCATETRRFNQDATSMGDASVLVVSTDLPFAMKRWCAAEGIDKVVPASDHRMVSLGAAYGVAITGGVLDRILARAVFVVGRDGSLKHVEYVAEIATEPDYAAVLEALKSA